MLRNIAEDRRSYLYCGGSLKSFPRVFLDFPVKQACGYIDRRNSAEQGYRACDWVAAGLSAAAAAAEYSHTSGLLVFVLHNDDVSVSEFMWFRLGPQNGCEKSAGGVGERERSGVGGLEVACWTFVPKFAGSHPREAVGFLGRKNPQHAFLRRGSKAVGPMS